GVNLIAQEIPTASNDNQATLDLGFTLSTASSGTINITVDAIAWAGIGTLTFWNHWVSKSVDLGFFALIIGTISIERNKDKRILKLRDRIADEVSASPGIHLRELHRTLGCAMGALQYHLKNLENDGQVVSLRAGNVRHIFPPEYSSEERVLLLTALARNPTVGSILNECMKNGQTTQAEISRDLDVDKSLISYYTSTLLKAEILRSIKVFGREKPVILTDWARTALTCSEILV
ncbi:MAG: winged helix-turn-helix transcriptional regulator, partial [Candidatus Thorarchaeota archaeon]|nr:winged helix-turn-helix transcriptional regulator [Candidatus Thorarchaeota archaeon]